jgi:hypothetical protein
VTGERTGLSVVVPVSGRFGDLEALHATYRAVMADETSIEFVYVLDGDHPEAQRALSRLREAGEPIRIVKLARPFGGAVPLSVGIGRSTGERVLVLPCRPEIDPAGIPSLLRALDGADVAAIRCRPVPGGAWRRFRFRIFHSLAARLLGYGLADIGVGVLAFRRTVVEELLLYGDRHHFLPFLAFRHGFRVVPIELGSGAEPRPAPTRREAGSIRALLDLLAVFFLLRFTKRPLRFFGPIGAGLFGAGFALSVWLAGQKLFLGVRLADRPLLLLGVLLIVLGVQVVALGLIGEIVVYTHARDIKEYAVEEIVG